MFWNKSVATDPNMFWNKSVATDPNMFWNKSVATDPNMFWNKYSLAPSRYTPPPSVDIGHVTDVARRA
jgi:hypothetical protein